MKKKLCTIFLIFIMLLMIPTHANADIYPVFLDSYAKQGTVGSEIAFVLIGYLGFDGVLEYDADVLEFISKEIVSHQYDDSPLLRPGNINILSNESGKLTFEYKNDTKPELPINLQFYFRIKHVPESKKTTIKYIPNDKSVLYNSPFIEQVYEIMPSSGVIEVCDQKECPEAETKIEKVEIEKIVEKPTKLTYFSFATSGILLITLIAVIIKQRKNRGIV